jgi:hypothetical protein
LPETHPPERPIPDPPPKRLGYFEVARRLRELRRFKGLLQHYRRWAPDMQAIAPVETFFDREPLAADPEYQWCLGESGLPTDPLAKSKLFQREINRLIPLVARDLDDVGISRLVSWTESEPAEDVDVTHDLIENCLNHDASGAGVRAGNLHRQCMAQLEQGIGVYEYLANKAIARWRNPIHWLAAVIRLPLDVLEAAGLSDEGNKSAVLTAYGWVMRFGAFLVLLLVAKKLGIEELVRDVLRLLGKG